MDQEVHIVGQHPAGGRVALEVGRLAPEALADAPFHGFDDRAAAALAGGGGDHEEVGEAGETAEVQHHHFARPFGEGDLGGEARLPAGLRQGLPEGRLRPPGHR